MYENLVSSNVIKETRPGCRNLQKSLLMVNLSGIFPGRMQ